MAFRNSIDSSSEISTRQLLEHQMPQEVQHEHSSYYHARELEDGDFVSRLGHAG